MDYIIYCRKSSEDSRRQAQSLGTQQRILTDFAKSHGLNVVKIFRESKSARFGGQRPLFDEMLEMIKGGKANAILVIHIDRLDRNYKDHGEITELIDKKILQEVRTPNDVYNTASSLLKMNIHSVFAENYSRELSVKVTDGLNSKVLRGEYPNKAPLGYQNVKGGITPDPDKDFFIKKIFKLYDSGYSMGKIAEMMYEDGLRSNKGNKLYKSSIENTLKKPTYYGVIPFNDVLYPGNHQPLISKELFDRVQERMTSKTPPRPQSLSFLYRGYLTCHKCGCQLTAVLKKGKYTYYYCTNSKGLCDQHKSYIPESELQKRFIEELQRFTPDKKLVELSFKRYIKNKRTEQQDSAKALEIREKQMAVLKKKLKNLEDMYLEERISGESFDTRKKEMQNELTDLQINKKQTKEIPDEKTLELVEKFKNKVISLWEIYSDANPEEKPELLESLLWNCGILNKNIVTTRYKEPYAHMERFKQTTDIEILSG